ncbi:MAG: S8 family serine peptidase [Candidatus Methanomethylicaceae archaeon]
MRIIWKSDGGNSLTRVSLFYGNGENEEGWNEVAYVNTPNPNTDYWLNYNLDSTSQLGRYHVCVYFNDNGGPPALVTMYVYFTGPGAPEENITGMAPGVKLVDVKVGEGNGLPYCLEGMEWVVAHRDDYNISVVSMSFGGRLSSLIDFAANNIVNNGIVAVVSAGNNGEGSHSKSPAAADNVITVAAVNINDKITEYSSQLAQAYATIKPDIAAPGGSWYTGNIIAAETNYDDIARNDGWPNDYTPFCGTSAAAPFVSGIAALIISALGGINYIKPWSKEKALKIKQLLLMTAAETNMPREITGQTVPLNYGEKDNIEGYGRINPLAAIELMKNTYNVGESRYFYLIPVSASSGYINALHNPVPPAPHVWASKVYLRRSTHSNDYYWFNISMNVASDVNIYLYEWDPDEYGQPILLAKTSGGGATSKAISFAPQRTGYYYVVVKADSGGDAYVTFRSSIVDNNPPEVQFLVTNSIIRKGVYCMNRSSEIYLFVEDISPTTVEFYVDQELKDFINGSTLRIDDGKHQLKWRVRDGKFTTERNVTIVMDNNPPQLKDLIVVSDLSSSKVHLYLEDLSGIKLIYYTTDDSLPDDIYNITQYWQACDFCVAGSFPEQVEAEITIEKKFEDKTLRVAVIDYCGNIRIVKIPIGKIDISPIIVIIGVAVAATVIVLVVNKKRNIIKIE